MTVSLNDTEYFKPDVETYCSENSFQDANCSGSAPDIDRVSRTVHISQFLINICMNERIDID